MICKAFFMFPSNFMTVCHLTKQYCTSVAVSDSFPYSNTLTLSIWIMAPDNTAIFTTFMIVKPIVIFWLSGLAPRPPFWISENKTSSSFSVTVKTNWKRGKLQNLGYDSENWTKDKQVCSHYITFFLQQLHSQYTNAMIRVQSTDTWSR